MFKNYNIRILIGLLILCLGYILAYNLFVYKGLYVAKVPYEILFDYQRKKASSSNTEIIFVGDSSLGNSIDSETFSTLSNSRTNNYALTGKFGFKGSLYMAKQAENPNLKTVIFMQTLYMFTLDVATVYVPSSKVLGLDISVFNFSAFKEFFIAIKRKAFKQNHDKKELTFKNDYIEQKLPNSPDLIYDSLKLKNIKLKKAKELYKISSYCQSKKLNCIYIHGPMVEDVCMNSKEYIEAVNQLVIQSGLKLARAEPVCIPKDKLGDAKDHVRSQFKKDYTKQFFEILAPHL